MSGNHQTGAPLKPPLLEWGVFFEPRATSGLQALSSLLRPSTVCHPATPLRRRGRSALSSRRDEPPLLDSPRRHPDRSRRFGGAVEGPALTGNSPLATGFAWKSGASAPRPADSNGLSSLAAPPLNRLSSLGCPPQRTTGGSALSSRREHVGAPSFCEAKGWARQTGNID